MQFYIIDKDPETSAKLLPDYALFKVNLREGWQILSDIGHIHGVTWEHQNNLYSASHALTRSFCTPESFKEFILNYEACLNEYNKRKSKGSLYENWFDYFVLNGYHRNIKSKLPKNKYLLCREYLLKYKNKHLTEEEKDNLERWIEEAKEKR